MRVRLKGIASATATLSIRVSASPITMLGAAVLVSSGSPGSPEFLASYGGSAPATGARPIPSLFRSLIAGYLRSRIAFTRRARADAKLTIASK